MTPSLLQTQFLKRYVTMTPKPIPVNGLFMNVSVSSAWFTSDGDNLTITSDGVRDFWKGVRKHGTKAVMRRPVPPKGPDNSPTGGTPVSVAA